MHISIIIPTYNEAENIGGLVAYLKSLKGSADAEIIVADGGSHDDTLRLAEEAGAKAVVSPVKGRAGQMNYGVQQAKREIYYFVHADSRPPETCLQDIAAAMRSGYTCGSFRFRFDSNKIMLRINAFFTRFNYLFFRGGDQSVFITKQLFQQVGGFDNKMLIMEDYDFLEKIWHAGKFKLVPKATLVSARKYNTNSWLTVQLANLKVVKMFRKGASQKAMLDTYKQMLNYRNNAF